jgi:hypothetical protein
VRGLDVVESATFMPFLPVSTHYLNFCSQASLTTLHVMVRLAELTITGVVSAGVQHAYKKVGEGLVDAAWDKLKAKLFGSSFAEVEVKLYGPDGELIKKHKGNR